MEAVAAGVIGWFAGWAAGKVFRAPDGAALVCSMLFGLIGGAVGKWALPALPLLWAWVPWVCGAFLLSLPLWGRAVWRFIGRTRMGWSLVVWHRPPALSRADICAARAAATRQRVSSRIAVNSVTVSRAALPAPPLAIEGRVVPVGEWRDEIPEPARGAALRRRRVTAAPAVERAKVER